MYWVSRLQQIVLLLKATVVYRSRDRTSKKYTIANIHNVIANIYDIYDLLLIFRKHQISNIRKNYCITRKSRVDNFEYPMNTIQYVSNIAGFGLYMFGYGEVILLVNYVFN